MHSHLAGFLSLRLITAGILTACASNTMAAGFALIEQSASQIGNAFAGSAAFANDASTIFFNPAGMTRLPSQFVGGLHAVKTSAKFDGTATDPAGFPVSGGNGGDAGSTGLVPNLYISTPVTDDLFVGLGINVPFGFLTDFASVPRFFWWLYPKWGKYGNAAVIHDYLYWEQSYPRKKSDSIFLEAMGVLKVNKFTARILYLAVYLCGFAAWKGNQRRKKKLGKRVLKKFTGKVTEWKGLKKELGSN